MRGFLSAPGNDWHVNPRLEGLTEPQRRLWDELKSTPDHFTLYGGVAIALRLGHRFSTDFDFFSRTSFDPEHLYRRIPYLQGAEVLQMEADTLTCSVMRGEPVKLSFFGVPTWGIVDPPEVVAGPLIHIASLVELAGTKAGTIQKRAAARDYIDLDALLGAGVELTTALAAARRIYGAMFNPQVTLKALTYFADGDLNRVSGEVRGRLAEAVKSVDAEKLAARIRESC